ncbi:MAG: molecular chaperone TorD family protein [Rhodocyclaceae bacterium]|nr:molecular chaperone TorD family protein [Rhodocyclaceae bacterium]MCC9000223.1 molecular chaperone TorD family protein [Candidatus Contendobacter sp.]MBK6554130.1 molecular chaperone TorD family protein [Rhodocyclaceae bacterium]MBK6677915.1 molecular chaperone TorD family protein [Rhodocyclaceae bacterium]MBK7813273.1 molecular chaperone TorD family protein [Rhodocyclaceae bacterium]
MSHPAAIADVGQDAARSLAYATFARAFRYPDHEALGVIRDGALVAVLRQLLGVVANDLVADTDWDALQDGGPDNDSLQEEFTRLFDTGEQGPACPLNGSQYRGSAMASMEELVRYYNHFGLSLPERRYEEPDHLTTQLEFLHYLTYQEAQLARAGEDVSGLLRAQRDFIVRHPAAWIADMRQRLASQQPLRFFLELTRLLERYLLLEAETINFRIGPATSDDDAPADRA